jgi:hypothetical protein
MLYNHSGVQRRTFLQKCLKLRFQN